MSVNPGLHLGSCQFESLRVFMSCLWFELEAEELCMMAAKTVPIIKPMIGFDIRLKSLSKAGVVLNPRMAEDMADMPYIRMAKPTIMAPMLFFLSFLLNRKRRMPIKARIGVKAAGLIS